MQVMQVISNAIVSLVNHPGSLKTQLIDLKSKAWWIGKRTELKRNFRVGYPENSVST